MKVLDEKKGVAGLEVLLSIISMLFMIGIIVMVFAIAGAKLQETVETGDFLATATVTNETEAWINATGYTLDGISSYGFQSPVLTTIWANTPDGTATYNWSIVLANATVTEAGVVTNLTAYNTTVLGNVSLSYTYRYVEDVTATIVINDTYQSLGGVTDWFPTFIILGALVVLILLVVIIITAIKRSKITEGA